MNTFVNAATNMPDSLTENGALTFSSSLDTCVDLFFRLGASRGKAGEIVNLFKRAYREDPVIAVRLALWARDVRGGAGERAIFRAILKEMPEAVQLRLLSKIVEVGRWDDLGVLVESGTAVVQVNAAKFWRDAVLSGNGLAAKWAPRKGDLSVKLRGIWEMSPKQYRKTIVSATNVVEQKMCSGRWNEIEFPHVPSVASARYNKAFGRNATAAYGAYKEALVKGEAKINASAIFPHDVVRAAWPSSFSWHSSGNDVDLDVVDAQWKALPDYTDGKANDILVMSDVSGSMSVLVSGSVSALQVSVALGLYVSERQTGPYKDLILTFDSNPQFHVSRGTSITQRIKDLVGSPWGMSTDLNKAFKLVLNTAVKNSVPASEMPKMLLVLSDMEFDRCGGDNTNFQALEKMYRDAGYELPKVVFWNLNSRTANMPVRYNQNGVGLVSGFSPSILKAILGVKDFTPRSIMLEAVLNSRYDVPGITTEQLC